MKSIRLLPVVIFAAVALLLFKGLGLLTNGAYVLVGTTAVEAAGDGGHAAPAAAAGSDTTLTMPVEPTMTDDQPTMDDTDPTLATKEEAGEGAHGEAPANGDEAAAHGEEAAHGDEPAAATANAGDHAVPPADVGHAGQPAAFTAAAEAIPMIQNSSGPSVPLATADGMPFTEKAVLERLAERRAELDARSTELDMRAALVEAAEQRLDERKTALEALEAQINALVAERKAMEEGEFKALVGMYETMKPSQAATIFDQLQMNVLVRLARGMNPRKMAPIMARMSPNRAEQLTVAMAAAEDAATIDVTRPDVSGLPQIVGQ